MASAVRPSVVPAADLQSFTEYLQGSTRILALLGAGLSAASGLPTFRGAGGLWRSYGATSLATPEAFQNEPQLVWLFYSHRRHMATEAQPNRAHYALAELAKRKPEFITLSQNVDGLSQRANHPSSQLHLLHGSLFDVKCTSFYCEYTTEDFNDPIVPALAIPKRGAPHPAPEDKTGATAAQSLQTAMNWQIPPDAPASGPTGDVDISDPNIPMPYIPVESLPHCPQCKTGLLRPGVVWFGEPLPEKTISTIENWIDSSDKIDLILVIGTSAQVYPAAGYIDEAREKGAKVAVVNMDKDAPSGRSGKEPEWFFQGDAGEIVPEILKSVIGEI
ncbi:hypothetical protein FQN54_001466 [Arachnomyces sp. PD_36]|nr:hypothetical protein FQN54_001466 [Arachnomyces sp. PD_36]